LKSYVMAPPEVPGIAVAGELDLFPVRRIYCVGRNYAAHAREMGHDDREPPFFFAKPADAVVENGATIPYPPNTEDLHHEVELVAAICRAGVDVSPDEALELVYGYAVGIDLTRRDRQAELKAKGRPWELAKAFDRSAPIGTLRPVSEGHLERGRIRLSVDGALRQDGDVSAMTWSPAEVIAALSRSFELKPGDLIFTGTPEGVGPVERGQTVEAEIEGLEPLRITIA
jgi:fumarylpyruvate hydrolase